MFGSIRDVYVDSQLGAPALRELTRCQDVTGNEDFILLREILAKDGGKLLVNVLRDMAQGTVGIFPKLQVHDVGS